VSDPQPTDSMAPPDPRRPKRSEHKTGKSGARGSGAGVSAGPRRLVHLELHTGDLPAASMFYSRLLGWRPEWVETRAGSYFAVATGGEVGAGIVQCATDRPLWLPYVEVERIDEATELARRLGAPVSLEPREGPAGWRSVVTVPDGGEIALWQPKEWR
jgi:predicted enzyme related to lactoylglutathione lyase